ncbi:MAG: hypothetical protein ACHREM_27600, partial [Polyangiales bacterium]
CGVGFHGARTIVERAAIRPSASPWEEVMVMVMAMLMERETSPASVGQRLLSLLRHAPVESVAARTPPRARWRVPMTLRRAG